MLVLGRHLHLPAQSSPLLEVWQRGGWVGVDLFFVLSGFLVSTLLFREFRRTGQIDPVRFLVRRGFKIYPAFWILLAFTLISRSLSHQPMSRRTILGELLFLQNYLGGLWPHTWSLAVEEQFYLSLILLFVFLVRSGRGLNAVPMIAVTISAICLILRIVARVSHPDFTYEWNLYGTHIRIDSLFFGVLLAFYHDKQPLNLRFRSVPTIAFVAIGLLLLSPAFCFPLEQTPWISIYGLILFYFGSAALLVASLRLNESRHQLLNGIGLLGAASYSIYLWHMPVSVYAWESLGQQPGPFHYSSYFAIYLIGSIVTGWIMNRLIENPMLLLRDRLFPSLQSSRVVAATAAPVTTAI